MGEEIKIPIAGTLWCGPCRHEESITDFGLDKQLKRRCPRCRQKMLFYPNPERPMVYTRIVNHRERMKGQRSGRIVKFPEKGQP